jgi:hypothetical protein
MAACGGGGSDPPQQTEASRSDIAFASSTASVTPFIALAKFTGRSLAEVSAVAFTIAPRAGAYARPVHVTWSLAALQARGDAPGDGTLTLPVFGLYANASNAVSVDVTFQDGSIQTLPISLATAAYVDPNGIYDHPAILQARDPGVSLGFDYIYLKSGLGTPIVIDTDGAIRWVATGLDSSFSSTFTDGTFIVGNQKTPALYRLELDGTLTAGSAGLATAVDFTHNIGPGKTALLAEFDTRIDGIVNTESTIAEMTPAGAILAQWDFAKIIGDYMTSHGDNAADFVRPGANWLHLNSSIYDPSDDSLIASSRENFVIKVDYATGDIVWILGDPTKYWYTFPSLRAKALALPVGDFYPIGQHALSFTSDGLLMLYDDGAPSFDQPPGEPAGATRPYSVVSAYAIDPAAMTAHEVWRYDHGQDIKTPMCGSAYQGANQSLLIDYATADASTHTRLVGLDAAHHVAFDYEYANESCSTGWNAQPIAFNALSIQ